MAVLAGRAPKDTPVVIWRGHTVLRNPGNGDLARMIGLRPADPPWLDCDLLVVGAGPAGLAASVYGASEGLSTVALDGRTGRVVWHYQTVHHDVWDFDVPAQPALFQIEGVGGGRPSVAQPTKMGHIFLLDRETGEPMYPVEERPVPRGDVPGETLSPTQPFPTHPGPLHPSEIRV